MSAPFHGNTLNQLSIGKAKTFVDQIDNLTENAPIVKAMPFKASSDQLWDVAAELHMLSGVGRVDLNAPLPSVQAADGLKQTNLNVFGAEHFVPDDTAKMEGGAAKYFEKNRAAFDRQSTKRSLKKRGKPGLIWPPWKNPPICKAPWASRRRK